MKVLMEHPNLGPDRRQTVDGEQFYLAWKPAGWVEVEIIHETGDTEFEEAIPAAPELPSWERDADNDGSEDDEEA